MRFNASSDSCSNVLVELSEVQDVMTGPVTGAAVSGVSLALIAAALICACHRKRPFISTAPCGGVRRRLEECEEDESDGDSESGGPQTPPDEAEPQWNRDVAAFALKARVVYPISQRYRPLADGASNPSLHEPSKRPAPPSQDSASSLCDDWLSRERDDDESSQFVSCGPSSKTHASRVFRRVQHYPQTPCHSRVSLLRLTLDELQRHASRLQREKLRMFVQILRVLLDETEHADIIQEAELMMRGVSVDEGAESGPVRGSIQEAELMARGVSVDEGAESGPVRCSEQEAEMLTRGVSVDEGAESGTVMCSVEEVEKAGREQLERSLQTAVSFAKQLERLGQNLRLRFSSDVSEEVMRSIIECLRLMEDVLSEVQASVLQMLLDRMECWQEVSDCLREKTALLKQEAELMVKVTGQSVEPLRADGQLEKQIVSDFQTAVREAVDQSADAVRRQTEALALERVRKGCVRRRRMMKAQSAEWSHVSDSQTDARVMMKAFAELQTTHWHQRRDFELQQDARITDALCERWTSLFGKCRGHVADLCAEFVLSSITADSTPSEDLGQSELKSMKLTVTNRMQQEERHAHTRLRRLREQLQRRRQVWLEDEALTRSGLDHFGEQQRAVVKAMVSRHADMQMSCALIEEQQHLLILEFQRILAARCFYLRSVKEMKLTVQSDTQDSCVAVETVRSDEDVIGQNLLHEQLSELEAAADVLQEHAHFLFGHALARAARLQVGGVSATDRQLKERLIDAACESVHVTRDSVQSLIREYYRRIRSASPTPPSGAAGARRSSSEDTRTQTEKMDYTRVLLTQLNNWARKPTSTELHHRVVELKKTCLTEFQKDLHCPNKTHNYRRLRDEEEAFMRRLASLAQVSLNSLKDDFTESLGP